MSATEELYLDTPEEIASYFGRLISEGHQICAVDTEADSLHSYETKMCLIQFAVPQSLAIIDPLAVKLEELEPMLDFFKSTDAIWMHGADYDMSMFRKTFNWVPDVVWDTQNAARLLGVQKYGLANLLESEFDLVVSKQSQKANWSLRPLTEKMLNYAFNDVRYLIELGDRYLKRLADQNRTDWFEELCAYNRKVAVEREERSEDEIWRINGWGKLEPRGLAFLRALWFWRDEECERMNRPHFKFMSNAELLNLSKQLQTGDRIEPPKYLKPAFARRMLKVISNVRDLDSAEFPQKYRKNGGTRLEIDENHFRSLRDYRDKVAVDLGIDSTLIATRQSLEILSSPNVDQMRKDGLLLKWQRELLKEVI